MVLNAITQLHADVLALYSRTQDVMTCIVRDAIEYRSHIPHVIY